MPLQLTTTPPCHHNSLVKLTKTSSAYKGFKLGKILGILKRLGGVLGYNLDLVKFPCSWLSFPLDTITQPTVRIKCLYLLFFLTFLLWTYALLSFHVVLNTKMSFMLIYNLSTYTYMVQLTRTIDGFLENVLTTGRVHTYISRHACISG